MCFSATVSFSAAVVLASTGAYAIRQASTLQLQYKLLAMTPVLFAIQQGFEGMAWLEVDAGNAEAAVPYAIGFHFFSHFLWLWWFPLCSYLVETKKFRQRTFLGLGMFGALAGGLVFFTLLFHPELMSVEVREYSLVYHTSSPYQGAVSIPIPASALYGLIVLVPLLFSSHRHFRIFGVLIALTMVVASIAYGYAFVSVWCFFAAALSLYLVFMVQKGRPQRLTQRVTSEA